MTVIGALSSFREPGEMSPHTLALIEFGADYWNAGDPKILAPLRPVRAGKTRQFLLNTC
jgi:hypothetical protein